MTEIVTPTAQGPRLNPVRAPEKLTEEVDCPICGTRDYAVLRPPTYPVGLTRESLLEIYRSSSDEKLMDQLARCKKCELVFLNPRVRSDIILESYETAVDPRFAEQNQMRIRTFKRAFSAWLKKNKIEPGPNLRVLDVGCAGGAFPKAVTDLGCTAVGVEPSKWLCEFGKKEYGLDLRPGTLEQQEFADASFDVVTLWDVIEHLFNPREILAEVRRILKPGGRLIVNYPEYASWPRKLLGYRWPFFLSVHLFYFTPATARKFLEKCGFRATDVRPYWQTLQAGYVFERAGGYFKIFNGVATAIRKLGMGEMPLRYYIGQTMVTATPRPTENDQ